jgi:hypothetical protein
MKKETESLLEFVDELEKKSSKNTHNAIIHFWLRYLILDHEKNEIKKVKKIKKPKKD